MQTNFSIAQLADPNVSDAESILRKCVHCGFCTATCPTYVTLGNELDSPRGRIYLIKDMLENDRPADEEITTHIDRCLSCLSCMTTCPSGVHYMHLVDHARANIEKTDKRPIINRTSRAMLAYILPDPGRFRLALHLAKLGRPFAFLFDLVSPLKPLGAMLRLASSPAKAVAEVEPGTFAAQQEKRGRVALLTGCAQPVLDTDINKSTIELLTRLGVEVVLPRDAGCCGSLVHHMGKEEQALDSARNMVDVWNREIENGGLDAIIITTSGCGTTIKDYGYMLRHDENYRERAERVAALAKDVTEYLSDIDLPEPSNPRDLKIAYHAACSLRHGQKITSFPKELLKQSGYQVVEPLESHLCCGSAGTYNILQPDIAARLKERKVNNLENTAPDAISAGNIGCITQIGSGTDIPIVHTVKLLDWAHGGKKPRELQGL